MKGPNRQATRARAKEERVHHRDQKVEKGYAARYF
jgi:hypothetical protein